MNIKPKLIDIEFLESLNKNVQINKNVKTTSKLRGYLSNLCISFFRNYADFIIVILFLGIILYFRYKYINKEKEKINNKKPSVLEIDYYRTNSYVDGKIVDTNDKVETSQNIDDNILNSIKDKISYFESELQPTNITNLSSYKSF